VASTDSSGRRLLTVGGVLSIAGGALQVFFGVVVTGLVIGFTIVGRATYFSLPWMPDGRFELPLMPTVGIVAVPVLILGIVGIAGGVSALRRRNLGLSLAGAICTLPTAILGIPAIIFVVVSRREFEGRQEMGGPGTSD
jgi:hypothetical protein